MLDPLATIIAAAIGAVAVVMAAVAALIGAVLGSLGTKVYEDRSRRRAEREELLREVVERYLLQLQEGVDDLWYRLDNLKNRAGGITMTGEYFEISTLYALGRVLAYERIFLLDGIYPQLERLHPDAGTTLRKNLRGLDQQLDQRGFHRYDRLSLAESVLERTDGYLHTSTYLEFKRRYTAQKSLEHAALASASKYIAALTKDEDNLSVLIKYLVLIVRQVASLTGFPSTIESGDEYPPSRGTGGNGFPA